MHLLRCPSNGCAMDCPCSHFPAPRLLETHVHKTAFWTVRNYDDHCTVVVAICGQSQSVTNNCMGLRVVLPLPHATYRLGAAAAKSQARLQGGLATLPTHIWFGLLDAMLLTKSFLWKTVCGIHSLPPSDMAEPSQEPS